MKFLYYELCLILITQAFEDESIDGEMLLQANDGFFKELNVPAFIQKIIIKNLQKELDKEQKQQD